MKDEKETFEELSKSKYNHIEEIYINFSYDGAPEDEEEIFYSNVDVLFESVKEEKFSYLGRKEQKAICLLALKKEGEYFFRDDLDPRTVDWIENYLINNV